jgi:hypothetical protein
MRSELALTSYTLENLFFHVLHERVPKFDHQTLTNWWTSPARGDLDRQDNILFFFILLSEQIHLEFVSLLKVFVQYFIRVKLISCNFSNAEVVRTLIVLV